MQTLHGIFETIDNLPAWVDIVFVIIVAIFFLSRVFIYCKEKRKGRK